MKAGKILILLSGLVFSLCGYAEDTVGYVKISHLKAFSAHLSIYLEDEQVHSCAPTPTGRFHSDVNLEHITSFLLTALVAGKAVQLRYACSDNNAWVSGVRLRSAS